MSTKEPAHRPFPAWRRRRWGRVASASLAATLAASMFGTISPVAGTASAQGLHIVESWSHLLPDRGHPVALSSPNVATLDGAPAVVVGDRSGHVYAFFLAGGASVPGWPASTGGVPVDSTPSVAALNPASSNDTVFVGVGDAATPHQGGYEAFNPNGTRRWYRRVVNPATDQARGQTSAVIASLAVGDLQGSTDVVAPSVGQEEYALNALTGATLRGFPWFTGDSGFSTPALADIYGNKTQIIEGDSQTAGLANWVQYRQGGYLRVLSPTGNAGTNSASGGLACEYHSTQVVESSPAVGPFLAGGKIGIVIGTGTYWKGASDTNTLLAFGTKCSQDGELPLAWAAHLDGATNSSPALADLGLAGNFQVIEGTDNGHGGGSVYALAGANGKVLWQRAVPGEVIGSVVTADLGSTQLVVVPTTTGVQLLDAKTGVPVATLEQGVGVQGAPLVTRDPDGEVGITVAGYTGANQGEVEHFELSGTNGSNVDDYGAWPMFHHDPQLTGDVAEFSFSAPATNTKRLSTCVPPVGGPNGYYEVNTAGRVFRYGNVAFCGSVPGRHMRGAAVGVTATKDGGGYWVADSAGQVFSFGDAHFYGPSRKLKLKSPIVAIAATRDGRGYWLVGANGQVFSFGDAHFYGPKKRLHLPAPISAIGVTANGRGYWLVARNGAIFTFGNAKAYSSAAEMNAAAVVGIAPDTSTGGYWLVSAAGKVWSFNAPAYGEVAGHGMSDAMTGVAALPGGSGYRVVDTGGELFSYGLATDEGSAYTYNPAVPVVGIAAAGG